LISKLKPSEKFGSDSSQKAQTTVEQVGCDTVELQWSMGRIRGILTNIQWLSCILIGCIFYGKVKYTHIYIYYWPRARSRWIKDLLSWLNNIEKMNFVLAYFRALKRKPVTCKSDGALWFSCFLVPSRQRKDRKSFYCQKKTFVNQLILQRNVITETKLKIPSGQYDASSCPLGKQITTWGLFHFGSSQSMPYNKCTFMMWRDEYEIITQ